MVIACPADRERAKRPNAQEDIQHRPFDGRPVTAEMQIPTMVDIATPGRTVPRSPEPSSRVTALVVTRRDRVHSHRGLQQA
jgi:hypothetical protein